MAKKKRLIIPIFIPFAGCPHQCVYCDQPSITATGAMPGSTSINHAVKTYLSTWKGGGHVELAFYGGTFTALPRQTQVEYLKTALSHVEAGIVHSIRVSTRPDFMSDEIAGFLSGHGVDTVELGVQSMSDEVLRLSGRGHTARDSVRAAAVLKRNGLNTGLQFMPGLPGDDETTIMDSAVKIADLTPDFVRVYPTVVLKDTPLHKMYLRGAYTPWPLDEMVRVCRGVATVFKERGIPVIRMGLQHTKELAESIAAGPHHPSFRQLVEG